MVTKYNKIQIYYESSYILTINGDVGFSSIEGNEIKSSFLYLTDSSSLASLKAFS